MPAIERFLQPVQGNSRVLPVAVAREIDAAVARNKSERKRKQAIRAMDQVPVVELSEEIRHRSEDVMRSNVRRFVNMGIWKDMTEEQQQKLIDLSLRYGEGRLSSRNFRLISQAIELELSGPPQPEPKYNRFAMGGPLRDGW